MWLKRQLVYEKGIFGWNSIVIITFLVLLFFVDYTAGIVNFLKHISCLAAGSSM